MVESRAGAAKRGTPPGWAMACSTKAATSPGGSPSAQATFNSGVLKLLGKPLSKAATSSARLTISNKRAPA